MFYGNYPTVLIFKSGVAFSNPVLVLHTRFSILQEECQVGSQLTLLFYSRGVKLAAITIILLYTLQLLMSIFDHKTSRRNADCKISICCM